MYLKLYLRYPNLQITSSMASNSSQIVGGRPGTKSHGTLVENHYSLWTWRTCGTTNGKELSGQIGGIGCLDSRQIEGDGMGDAVSDAYAGRCICRCLGSISSTCLCLAFTFADPTGPKRLTTRLSFFVLSGSLSVKVTRRLLMKLTPVVASISSTLNVKNFCTNVIFSSYIWLGAKNLYKKRTKKTLMKLTPEVGSGWPWGRLLSY